MALVTFDVDNLLIIVNTGITELDVRVDLYSDWKEWVLASDNNAKIFQAFEPVGGNFLATVGGADKFLSGYFFLKNGWRIRPQEANHELVFTNGYVFVDGGGNPIVPTVGGFTVTVTRDIPADAYTLETPASGLTPEESQALTDIAAAQTLILNDIDSINTAIGTINTRLTTIEGDIGTIQTDIGTIDATLTSIDGRLTTIEGDVGTIQTDIGTIQVDINSIDTRLLSIEGDIGTIQTDISSISGNIVTIQTDIATIKTDISDLKVTSQFMADIEGGRWKVDVGANQMLFYKADNVTEVARFNLFDELGTPTADPSRIAERRRV